MGNFSNLPSEMILDILTRLPTETVLECKLVCKPWRDLVSNSSFSQMHLAHLNHSPDSGKLSFLVLTQNAQLYYFEYDENNDETPVESIRRINLTHPFTSPHYHAIGSLNGLVCLYGYEDHTTCICNPVTKEYVVLPKSNRDWGDHNNHCVSGFGYLPSTNEYKVVELYKGLGHNFVSVVVYTLGSGKGWRNVGRLDSKHFKRYVSHAGVFVNGALYWRDDEDRGRAFVFDVTEEKCSEYVWLPPTPPAGEDLWYDEYIIGDLGGVLFFAVEGYNAVTDCSCYNTWLLKKKNDICDMREQVEHEPFGWNKEFRIPGREPLTLTKSGRVLCYDDYSLGIYDVVASTSKELATFRRLGKILPHKNTLVSFKELGEEHIHFLESAKIEGHKAVI